MKSTVKLQLHYYPLRELTAQNFDPTIFGLNVHFDTNSEIGSEHSCTSTGFRLDALSLLLTCDEMKMNHKPQCCPAETCFVRPHLPLPNQTSVFISSFCNRNLARNTLDIAVNRCVRVSAVSSKSCRLSISETPWPLKAEHHLVESTPTITPAMQNPPPVAMHVKYDGELPVLHVNGFSKQRFPQWFLLAFFIAALWLIRRIVVIRHMRKLYSRDDLPADIASFYDLRSAAWESVWGEHMHHGLYDRVTDRDGDGRPYTLRGTEAQIRTMSELLRLARSSGASILPGTRGTRILDVGCGIGGASRYLARTFGTETRVNGITLSPVQAARATELNEEQRLGKQVTINVQNAHSTDFETEWFDLVWSLESAEHMYDKRQFIKECTRVLRPGAPFVMVAWCIRESNPPLSLSEKFAIRKIMEQYCLPRLAPPSEYQTEMIRAGLVDVSVDDWTDRAAPFWGEVIRSATLNPKGISALFKYGWPLLRSALATRHVIKGISLGAFRLVAFTGRKPLESEAEKYAKIHLKCQEEPSENK